MPGGVSSQYFSALLMVGPCSRRGMTLEVEGDLVSKPYIEVTAQAMRAFGANMTRQEFRSFDVRPGSYTATTYAVEPDASAASYFFAAAAVTGGRVVVPGLGTNSLQGDLDFVKLLEKMGCQVRQTATETEVVGPPKLRGIEVDMANVSDTAQTLAAIAPFASSPTRVTGIGFIRKKETNRVAAVVNELKRLGIRAEEEDDGFVVHPGAPQPAQVETYEDHRMAMSFSLVGLMSKGVESRIRGASRRHSRASSRSSSNCGDRGTNPPLSRWAGNGARRPERLGHEPAQVPPSKARSVWPFGDAQRCESHPAHQLSTRERSFISQAPYLRISG